MAIKRPLTFTSGTSSQGMREASDSEMGLLRYNLAVAYGDSINNGIGNQGCITTGTGKADIFSPGGSGCNDTKRNQASSSNTAGGSAAEDYPAYPGASVSTVSTTRWQQNFDTVGSPSNATYNSSSYLYYTGNNFDFRYLGVEADIVSTIISDTISEMRTGHGVGTYYVGTGAPFLLGNGTWTDKGVCMSDTTYSNGTTTYRLYLKRNLSDPSPYTGGQKPLYRWQGSPQGFKEIDLGTGGSLIQNVLLPILRRNNSGSGKLQYQVKTSSSGLARGSMIDRRQEGVSHSRNYSSPNYTSTTTPSGGSSNITTYYLNLI